MGIFSSSHHLIYPSNYNCCFTPFMIKNVSTFLIVGDAPLRGQFLLDSIQSCLHWNFGSSVIPSLSCLSKSPSLLGLLHKKINYVLIQKHKTKQYNVFSL